MKNPTPNTAWPQLPRGVPAAPAPARPARLRAAVAATVVPLRRGRSLAAACSLWLLVAAPVLAGAQRPPTVHTRLSGLEQAHLQALDSFRRARFSEAYGRFIKLAEAGHPASARYAIWMCENGLALFGVMWDCAPQELEDWGQVARTPLPTAPVAAQPVRRR